MIPAHILAHSREAVRIYESALSNGATEAFAEMAALQSPPGTRGSERAFMEGRMDGSWMNSMPEHVARRMVRQAEKAGINTTGKFYMGGLADKRAHMDPEAWVESTDDVRRVAKKRSLEVHGIIDYVPPEAPPPKPIGLSKKIINENVKKELKKNPAMRREDAVEKVKDRMTPSWKKKNG